LLAESNLEDALFIQDVFAEIDESAEQGRWNRFIVAHVVQLSEVKALLSTERYDVVLLNPTLEDASGRAAIVATQAAAGRTPILLLVNPDDEGLARRSVREGIQDYLLKGDVDCRPLSRAVRNAIERQRFVEGVRSSSTLDPLTGLLNLQGFEAAALREERLACETGQRITMLLAEIDNFVEIERAYGSEQAETTVREAADVLRQAIGERALLGRVGPSRFAALAWNEPAPSLVNRIQSELSASYESFAFAFGWAELSRGCHESVRCSESGRRLVTTYARISWLLKKQPREHRTRRHL
jgi:diguanylate cyclase (GGDEF)-like protein